MKTLNGLFAAGILTLGISSSTYIGQEQLDKSQALAVSYRDKTNEVVKLAETLKVERDGLSQQVSDLQKELERHWNTEEEVNALIEETKVLRHRISILEEQLANVESNQEIEKANQSATEHLEQITSILDESIFNGVID